MEACDGLMGRRELAGDTGWSFLELNRPETKPVRPVRRVGALVVEEGT